jgi:hypothetical protein
MTASINVFGNVRKYAPNKDVFGNVFEWEPIHVLNEGWQFDYESSVFLIHPEDNVFEFLIHPEDNVFEFMES